MPPGKGEAGAPGKGDAGAPGDGAAGAGGSGGGTSECPEKAPKAGETCAEKLQCSFEGTKCDCVGPANDSHWDCKRTPAACPEKAPTEGAKCVASEPPQTCPYPGDVQCVCEKGSWHCPP
jgi:hypothetical protein